MNDNIDDITIEDTEAVFIIELMKEQMNFKNICTIVEEDLIEVSALSLCLAKEWREIELNDVSVGNVIDMKAAKQAMMKRDIKYEVDMIWEEYLALISVDKIAERNLARRVHERVMIKFHEG